jgi:hypothetical protein
LLVFQGLGVIALGACAWLLTRLARAHHIAVAPGAIALAFVLNPLVLIESAWDAHLDVTAYALVLGALLSVERAPRRWWWAVLAALAINIKLPYVLFLPALVVRAAAGRDSRALLRTALGATFALLATSAVLYAPYWHGLATLAPLSEHTERDPATRSIALVVAGIALVLALREFKRGSAAGSIATAAPMTLIGAAYWLPWHSVAAVGELLRLGARASVYVVVITLVGRLGTAVYFTASQHYGHLFEWPSPLLLPGGLYRAALAVLLVVAAARFIDARRRSTSHG